MIFRIQYKVKIWDPSCKNYYEFQGSCGSAPMQPPAHEEAHEAVGCYFNLSDTDTHRCGDMDTSPGRPGS